MTVLTHLRSPDELPTSIKTSRQRELHLTGFQENGIVAQDLIPISSVWHPVGSFPCHSAAMSLGRPLQLMRSLRKSPALFHHRFRHDRAQSLSHGDPLFKVHYLGTEKIYSLDMEQAEVAISHLLERSPAPEKLGKEHALVVRPRYIEVKEISTGRQLTKTYLRDIAYCAADAERPNVFLYICKQQGQQLQCRVFWCSRPEKVKDMTNCLARSFQSALSDLQESGSNRTQGEDLMKEGRPLLTNGKAKSCTMPRDLRKGRSTRTLSSRSPLREMMRRTSISD
ncbi:uncharacterized protein LOC105906654 [Clupea harengus]|uniref:Uncharacterized protein LOC105906654 n=1 Tax=Clupea harengus TaxID=7950 RepID=A0A6P3W757_CLUHA|nr:uncharacterized protein LOC105906654 [Clupea harengus]